MRKITLKKGDTAYSLYQECKKLYQLPISITMGMKNMNKNTLTWKVTKTIPTACPNHKPDPYTGEYPSTHCLVYHCKTITETKSMDFNTKEEAKSFAEKAPYSCCDFRLNGELLNL